MSPTSTQWGTYARIAEALRARLALCPPGSPVPSETALSREFGVARNTVRRALGKLAQEGLVGTVPGRGRVVLAPALPAATLPAYRRIAADLQRAIAAGELAPGDPLPSEATLTREYEVSRGTARQALSFLASLGLVRAVPGKGRFVQAATSPNGG
ncbi:MAG: GntR family transcriptional regulator [Pseudonocardiaceae bacterium]